MVKNFVMENFKEMTSDPLPRWLPTCFFFLKHYMNAFGKSKSYRKTQSEEISIILHLDDSPHK